MMEQWEDEDLKSGKLGRGSTNEHDDLIKVGSSSKILRTVEQVEVDGVELDGSTQDVKQLEELGITRLKQIAEVEEDDCAMVFDELEAVVGPTKITVDDFIECCMW